MRRGDGPEAAEAGWKGFYRLGGAALLVAVAVVLAEIAIGFLPGVAQASQRTVTVADWFALFQSNWVLGLRNLGLVNLIGAAVLTPAMLAIWSAQRRENEPWSALGAVLFFMGMAVYVASYRGFAMLSLSGQYTVATTEAQRALLAAAGQAMLAEGKSRVGLFLIDAAGLLLSIVMLRGKVFGKAAGFAGVAGNGLMMVFEIMLVIAPQWFNAELSVAMAGGVGIMVWYLLVGRRLLQLGVVRKELAS